jgi:hypothetical protein
MQGGWGNMVREAVFSVQKNPLMASSASKCLFLNTEHALLKPWFFMWDRPLAGQGFTPDRPEAGPTETKNFSTERTEN